MMRASVLLVLAPIVIGVVGCRDNPGFQFTSNSAGPGGSADDADATASGTGDSTAGESGAVACEPVPVQQTTNVCDPWAPFTATLPNFSVLFATCEADDSAYLKRTGDVVVACTDSDCTACDNGRTLNIGAGSTAAMTFGSLLPRDNSCSRFVHRGAALIDSPDPCNSVAYALLDDQTDKLRFAVAYNDPDPFIDLLPEAGLTVKPDTSSACPDGTPSSCDAGGVVPLELEFKFGDCRIPATLHGATWKSIVVDDADYTFEVRSAFQCLTGGRLGLNWYLHLDQ